MLYSRSLEINHVVLLKLYTLNSISHFPSPHPDAHLYPLKSHKNNHVWALLPEILIKLVCIWSPRWSTAVVANQWSERSERLATADLQSVLSASPAALTEHITCALPLDHSVPTALAVFLFLENTQPVPTPGPLLLLVPLLDVLSSLVHLVNSYLLKATLCGDLPCLPSLLPWFFTLPTPNTPYSVL